MCGSVRSLQRRFPVDDVPLRSGYIHHQIAKSSKFCRFGRQMFGGARGLQMSNPYFLKSGSSPNVRQSLVTIDREPSEIWRQKTAEKRMRERVRA